MRIGGVERRECHGAICRAKVDADAEFCHSSLSGCEVTPRLFARGLFHPELKLELPAAIRTGVFHPELKVTKLGHYGINDDWNRLAFRKSLDSGQRYLNSTGFFQLALGVGNDLARQVAAANFGRKEAKVSRLSGHEPELLLIDQQLAPLLHPLRNDADGFDRWLKSRDSGHGRFQTNVVGAGGARLDPNPLAGSTVTTVQSSSFGNR